MLDVFCISMRTLCRLNYLNNNAFNVSKRVTFQHQEGEFIKTASKRSPRVVLVLNPFMIWAWAEFHTWT